MLTHRLPALLTRSLLLTLLSISGPLYLHAQEATGQEVCVGDPSGSDIFSVGEIRTSILPPTDFQELNGTEWVLLDGRPLAVRTALSPHLSARSEHGQLLIPDARGRFLRMVNAGVCNHLRHPDDPEDHAYNDCMATRDPDGDRLPGNYQADALAKHGHGYNDVYWSEYDGGISVPRAIGNCGGCGTDRDNRGFGWDRTTLEIGDVETRPRNVSVNYFLKICNCRSSTCK